MSLVSCDHKTSKTNLKGRITDMFKRSTSQSQNDSEDMDSDTRNGVYSKSNTPHLSSRQNRGHSTMRPVQVSVQLSLCPRVRIRATQDIKFY